MQEKTLIGYYLIDTNGIYVVDGPGATQTSMDQPAPVSIADAYRITGKYLSESHLNVPPRMERVEQVRELTPLECTSRDLAQRLLSLTSAHGLDLGLTPAQVERKITEELVALGSTIR